MRLLTDNKATVDKPAKRSEKPAQAVSGKSSANGSKGSAKAKTEDSEPAPAAAASVAVDYTRPQSTTELLVDLQRRVINLETISTRRLTAGEYAIAVEAMTGQSLEAWKRQGYVVENCSCTNLACKGWRMVNVNHYRTEVKGQERDSSPVRVEELKDVPPDFDAIFDQMFKDGKLKKGKNDSTLIPKDGPISWTHQEQLAFAKGFEMDELLALEGKPRELQRQLIASLREAGYDILSAPEK